MQQVVRLLGDLGERYGAEHTYFNLRTPADAIKLLCINSPAFQEELMHAHEHGVGYRLIQAGTDLDLKDLQLPFGSNDLILTPVIAGSGGVGKAIAGVALIAAAVFLGPSLAIGGAGFLGLQAGAGVIGGVAASAIGSIGASLVLGGIAEMLSPQPTIPKLGGQFRYGSGEASSTDGPQGVTRGTDGRQSYAYTGAANTVGVGATIPVAYGEVLVGSHLISANVEVSDESDPLKTAIREPGTSTIRVGGEELSFGDFETASGVKVKRTRKDVNGSDNDFKQIDKFIELRSGETETEGEIDESTRRRDKLDFIFELRDGLFDFVSGPGSTLVDAFFIYRIEVIVKRGGPDQVIATSQATVQGLLNNGDNYRWMHRIEHPDVDSDDEIKARISIVDQRANSKNTLFWQSYGYDLD